MGLWLSTPQFIFRLPSSGTCTFPSCFPDATTTGVPSGTSLSSYSGPSTITTNNTAIVGKTITSCPLTIQAIGVTITNSRFSCSGENAVYIDDQGMYSATSSGTVFAVTITDSEISCGSTALAGVGKTGVQEAYAKLVRVEITHCENGTSVNQKLWVEDSFIHDLATDSGGSHSDGGEAPPCHWEGGGGPVCSGMVRGSKNITWTHNTLFGMSNGDTDFETSGLIFNHGTDPDTNVLVQYNLMAGGSYAIYCVQDGVSGTNFVVDSNHFTNRFSTKVGQFAPTDSCGDETFTNNVCHESGAAMTASTATCSSEPEPFYVLLRPIAQRWMF